MDVNQRIISRLATELGVRPEQVSATVELLDGGATVPFIARYRKEVTGALDDIQLRQLDERLRYLRELEERRAAVLVAIDEQGKLDATLKASIDAAETKQRLEDLYLPFKKKAAPKRKSLAKQGLSRWRMRCLPIQRLIRKAKRKTICAQQKAIFLPSKMPRPLWMAPSRS